MTRIFRLIAKLKNIAVSLFGGKLIDPIEVYYDVRENYVYPILSKSGNSSLKLTLIKKYNLDFEAKFPDIHLLEPSEYTSGNVERIFFWKPLEYVAFCKGKNIRVVIRNPYERYYSFYLGVKSERNRIYRYPSETHRIFGITKNTSFQKLLLLVCFIPDSFADRHFRSQSYYLRYGVKSAVREIEVHDLVSYLRKENDDEEKERSSHLNKSNRGIPENILNELIRSKKFQNRYSEDLDLYRISTILPSPSPKN